MSDFYINYESANKEVLQHFIYELNNDDAFSIRTESGKVLKFNQSSSYSKSIKRLLNEMFGHD